MYYDLYEQPKIPIGLSSERRTAAPPTRGVTTKSYCDISKMPTSKTCSPRGPVSSTARTDGKTRKQT